MTGWEKALNDFTVENFSGGLRDWYLIHGELRDKKLQTVTPEAAAQATRSPRAPSPLDALLGPSPMLLDVREEKSFRAARPAYAVSAPLYVPLMEPKNAYEWYRVASFAIGFAMRPPVRDRDWLAKVDVLTGGNKRTPLYVLCGMGGTMETASERKQRAPRLPPPINGEYGCASRSLIAAHELLAKGGYTNVKHVEGGYALWANRELPGETDAD